MSDKALQRLEWLEAQLGVRFPREILSFWKLACSMRPLDPLKAFEESLGLTLVGAFEVLSGKFDGWDCAKPISLHWRYTLDPPEFFTLLVQGDQGWHAGYLLDDVSGNFGCVASTYADEGLAFAIDGLSLFEALKAYTRDELEFEGEVLDSDGAVTMGARFERFASMAHKDILQRLDLLETLDGGGIPLVGAKSTLLSQADLSRLEELVWSDEDFSQVLDEARQHLLKGNISLAWKLARDVWQVGDEPHLLGAGEILAKIYAATARQSFQKILEDHLAELNREWLDLAESN